MLKHLKQSGADVTSNDIVCAPCDFARAGGFSPTGVIVLCQDKFMSKGHMEDTMVHELVHMYDHAKFKVDWDNLRHHACSEVCVTLPPHLRVQPRVFPHECGDGGADGTLATVKIRANSLSGDCRWSRAFRRGFVSFSKPHQAGLADVTPRCTELTSRRSV